MRRGRYENGSIHYIDILNPSCSKLIIKTMLKKSTLVAFICKFVKTTAGFFGLLFNRFEKILE